MFFYGCTKKLEYLGNSLLTELSDMHFKCTKRHFGELLVRIFYIHTNLSDNLLKREGISNLCLIGLSERLFMAPEKHFEEICLRKNYWSHTLFLALSGNIPEETLENRSRESFEKKCFRFSNILPKINENFLPGQTKLHRSCTDEKRETFDSKKNYKKYHFLLWKIYVPSATSFRTIVSRVITRQPYKVF